MIKSIIESWRSAQKHEDLHNFLCWFVVRLLSSVKTRFELKFNRMMTFSLSSPFSLSLSLSTFSLSLFNENKLCLSLCVCVYVCICVDERKWMIAINEMMIWWHIVEVSIPSSDWLGNKKAFLSDLIEWFSWMYTNDEVLCLAEYNLKI